MPHFVIILNASFGFHRIHSVRADRYEVRQGQGRLLRGDRVVYQAPEEAITEVVPCAHGAEAAAFIEAWRLARRTDGGWKLEEPGIARRQPPRRFQPRNDGAGSPIVEGVSLSVVEPPARRTKG